MERQQGKVERGGLVPGVNVLGYTAALAAYRDGEPWLEAVLRYLEANRDFLVEYVRAHLAYLAAMFNALLQLNRQLHPEAPVEDRLLHIAQYSL